MKVIVFVFATLMLLPGLVFCQTDAKAEKILKATKDKVSALNDVSATITRTLEYVGSNKAPVKVSGKLKMRKEKFAIDLGDQLLMCNGATVWTVLKNDKEVTINNYDAEESISPERMFKISTEKMKCRYEGTETVAGVTASKITLLELDSKKPYMKIEVWVDNARQLPVKMKLYYRNSTAISYELANLDVTTKHVDTTFSFDSKKFPGFEVIDNR